MTFDVVGVVLVLALVREVVWVWVQVVVIPVFG